MSPEGLPPSKPGPAEPAKHGKFSPGQVLLGRYTLRRVLGRGGMGIVWLAHDSALDLEIALKFVPEALLDDREAIEDLKNETRRCLRLTHPNIVRVYDFIQGEGWAGISMEFMDGGTLSDLRMQHQHRSFETDEVAVWLLPMCDALDYAHEKVHLVHRDLKPSNLMVSQKGELKLADFGIARSVSDSMTRVTSTVTTSGTLTHMSPQQLAGEPPKPSDDLYSLGATIYDLLTGRPPFLSGDIVHQVLEKVPPPMAQRRRDLGFEGKPIPATWEKTVAACLSKDPQQRPRTALEVARRVGLSSATVAQAPPDVATTRVDVPAEVSPSRSNAPRWQTAGAGVLLAATVLLVWFLGIHRPAEQARQAKIVQWETVRNQKEAEARAAPLPADRDRLLAEAKGAAEAAQRLRTARERAALEAERRANARGGVIVRTEPEGAVVTLGGEDTQKSPATFRGLRLGKYPVRVALDGYAPVALTIEVKEDQFVELGPVRLTRTFGSVTLTTVPDGINYELRGAGAERKTGRTPASLQEVPTGSYTLTLKRAGWPDCVRPLRIEPGGNPPVAWEYGTGWAVIRSDPPGAEILLGAKPSGKTPLRLELQSGTHQVTARYKDWPPQGRALLVSKGGEAAADFEFASGTLNVQSEPAGAEVLLDGRLLGRTPFTAEVPTGTRSLCVRASPLLEQTRPIEVRRGGTQSVAATFEYGKLDVRSTPESATVRVGGVALGRTPIRGILLPPGEHVVEVSRDEHISQAGKVQVRVGETATYSAELLTVSEAKWRKIPGKYRGTMEVTDNSLLGSRTYREPMELTVGGTASSPIVVLTFSDVPITGRYTVSNDGSVQKNFTASQVVYEEGTLRFAWFSLGAKTSMVLEFDSRKATLEYSNLLAHGRGTAKFSRSD